MEKFARLNQPYTLIIFCTEVVDPSVNDMNTFFVVVVVVVVVAIC